MKRWQKVMLFILILIVAVPVILWRGLRMKPSSFPAYTEHGAIGATVPLPEDLPTPVTRFYEVILNGGAVPVIESAVITGMADTRMFGLNFYTRFRFTHEAGQNYRHYLEGLIFNQPMMKVNEWYLDGAAKLQLPFGTVANEPKVDRAANLGLWGESVWLPGIFITDPRVRWEAIDETTARLIVPYGEDNEDEFTVHFDAETRLITRMEALRWREATDTERTGWILDIYGWQWFNGMLIPSPAAATWAGDNQPWAVFTIEDVAYNVNVSGYIRDRGV